ncbi:ROK family protein [Algoriphagus sp. CAU 1675]|uniref:ROK family protein n=1 Tax=Algoriphagus sp. CAU 1675 TaxID=3032597 RepID=UPI0023DC27C2|nr:ROK family protein [Algoriphagus sp. CAU 1675]MDF2158325.1 ROK family protein [Algoriphagus sp. CAU 1675]
MTKESRNRGIIGVDIGGSHISAAKAEWNGDRAEVLSFAESDVDTFGNVGQIIEAWSSVIRKVAEGEIAPQIGIAMPGPFDYSNGISLIQDQGKMKSLFGLSVKNLLAESLGIPPENIAFTNDAEAFLKGESFGGAGRNFSNSLGLTLGTGLGSAIKMEEVVKDAKLWTAPFRDGIAEDYLGTGWFKKYAKDKFGMEISGVRDLVTEGFDPLLSQEIFKEFGRSLGEFLFPYLIRLHSEGVVLGGKISKAASFFLPFTEEYLKSMQVDIPFQVSELGENAALIGATLHFVNESIFSSRF